MPRASSDAIKFEAWVPKAARTRLIELSASPLAINDVNRSLLKRLACYPAMKTEVWEKLPSEPKGLEGTIIDWTFLAFTVFPMLRRPYPKTKAKSREYAKHWQKHVPLPDPAYPSQLAYPLWDQISSLKLQTDFYWARLWQGDKTVSTDQVLAILEQLGEFYARMDKEYRNLLSALPRVTRWSPKGGHKFFTEYLSRRMQETYGRPLDSIVAALGEVAFDLTQGVASETVRGRRRLS